MRTMAAALLLGATFVPVGAQNDLGPPVRVMLFSDASYLSTEREVNEGFSLGQVVGHLNAALSPRLSVAAEATITSRSSGPLATVERLILAYDVSDALRLSAGRYHTPISWWNTQYHHGLWLQTSIDRPNMVRFGTPLIPVHFLGLLASGNLAAGAATVVYEAGVGNGRDPNLAGPGDAGDPNGAAAFLGGLRLRTPKVPGLEVGVHGYLDEVDSGTGATIDERIWGGHLAWMANPAIVLEYLHFAHEQEGSSESTDSDAFYAQIGFRLPPAPSVEPYVRFESVDIGTGDPLFSGLGLGYEGVIGGVRWDFADYAALKGELRREELAGEWATSVALNASFVIPNIIH